MVENRIINKKHRTVLESFLQEDAAASFQKDPGHIFSFAVALQFRKSWSGLDTLSLFVPS